MRQFISFLLTMSVMISCQDVMTIDNVVYTPLGEITKKVIKTEVISSDTTVILSRPTDITIVGDYLIILDEDQKSGMILIYNKQTGEFVASCCPKGRGPGECLRPSNIVTDLETNSVSVYDAFKKVYNTYNIDSIVSKTRPYYKEFPLRYARNMYSNCFKLGESTCI